MIHVWLSLRSVRRLPKLFTVLCAVAMVGLAGCSRTPQEAIVGRWYNSEMSLRFQPNGGVIWNTPQGLAQGRYSFVGHVPRWATDNTSAKVRLELIRNNEPINAELDLQFVGGDRLRVKPMETTRSRSAARTQAVLRRSETATDPNVLAPSKKPVTGVRGVR